MTIRKPSAKQGGRKKKGGSKRPRANAIPPKDSQRITLDEAVALTQRYRKASPASEHGGFFWGEGIQAILAQPGCVGLRYYHGLDAQGAYQIVLVGVDGNGNDITKSATTSKKRALAAADSGAVLLDRHWPCPPWCADDSPLL